jgi:photosystem II stability/assembly factor-like uncharacterized protein
MLVTSYKVGGVILSNILNTENQSYYGDITTNYTRVGSEIGTIFSLKTFSPAPLSITSSNYTANINQYNTGLNWNGATFASGGGPATGDWRAVSMSTTGQFGVACQDTGNIYYSSDYGLTWTLSTSAPAVDWASISISSDGTKAIAGDYTTTTGQIYYSSDSGVTWTLSTSSVPGKWISVSISSSGQYAVGCIFDLSGGGESIYYSSDSGVTWTIAPGTVNTAWEGISISSSGQYAIACAAGTAIYYSSDYGHTWIASNSPSTSVSWRGVAISSSGQYGIACSNNNPKTIYWSDDYGNTWNLASVVSDKWERISISSTGQYGIVCPESGNIYYSFDYGKTWVQSLLSFSIGTGVSISSNGQYALACSSSTFGQIYYSSNTSTTYANQDLTAVFEPLYKYKTWPNSGSGSGVWSAVSTSATGQFVIACEFGGSIYWSANYGGTWAASSVTPTPALNDWFSISMSSSGQYAVVCIGGSVAGQIYYSSDSGQTWTGATFTTSGSPPASANWLSVSISGNGLYAVACTGVGGLGRIYYSSNSGQTWTQSTFTQNNYRCISMSATGEYAVCGVFGGDLYWSNNYGQNWSTASSGISTRDWGSITISSSGEYAIATVFNGQIYHSSDKGQSWSLFSSSPTADWYSVSISNTGQYAVACATTNNYIYWSDDYGVSWTQSSSAQVDWQSVALSGNTGQYAYGCGTNTLIVRCLATN